MRRVVTALIPLGLVVSLLGGAPFRKLETPSAAAPTFIILTGEPLTKRVVLADWNENHRLMLAMSRLVRVPDESLAIRPSFRVAMYWGLSRNTSAAGLPDTVPPQFAPYGAQSGIFYPRSRGREALWLFGAMRGQPASLRVIGDSGLRILERHGVPTSR